MSMAGVDLSVVPYGITTTQVMKTKNGNIIETKTFDKNRPPIIEPLFEPDPKLGTTVIPKYRECMRNHAASIGGHANDGCGEFMSAGARGTPESLICAACSCHRNFHRRVQCTTPAMLLYDVVPTCRIMKSDATFSDRRSETPDRGDELPSSRTMMVRNKRCRTKFTTEQKGRMLEYAERSGWRIQKPDDVALAQFCSEVGVERNVLKVWMQNNKNAHRRGEAVPTPEAAPPPHPPEHVGSEF